MVRSIQIIVANINGYYKKQTILQIGLKLFLHELALTHLLLNSLKKIFYPSLVTQGRSLLTRHMHSNFLGC
jgi:hypothetical protein